MKNIKFLFQLGILLLVYSNLSAQTFSGWVVDHENNPLPGASVYWKDSILIGTVTDAEGHFELKRLDTISPRMLYIRHVSYAQVEVEIFPYEDHLKLKVEQDAVLETTEIIGTKRDAFTSTLNPINVETLTACELKRAACCSLAESFENNGAVNVSYSDAVTGAREIEMLGLRGIYTQMMIENRPTLNRLGRAYGLEYIPGSWIESIQVSKGASTVRNGVQGITGQINTELIKPNKSEPFYINFYAGNVGRFELNTNLAYRFNKKWSTGLLLHGNYFQSDIDHNHDHFLDIPQKKQINALWRLFHSSDLLHFELNFQAIYDNRNGGQTSGLFNDSMPAPPRLYRIENEARRMEAFGKIGYLGFKNPLQSLAFVWSTTMHHQKGLFGDRLYDAFQKSIYGNLIFQTPLNESGNQNLNAGVTYTMDDFDEKFTDILLDRTEQQASLFAEYDYNKILNKDKGQSFGVILGMRGDWVKTNNYRGLIPSPRINLKYNVNDNLILRASGGRGMRLPNLLIENIRYMPGARNFVIEENILPELAWNYGLNLAYNFEIESKAGSLTIDAYRTEFENQYISDVDKATDAVHFYNLKGKSYSNSILVAWTQDIIKGLEIRLAYKFNDVRATMNDTLLWQTFAPQHRALVSLHYVTPNKGWQFNANAQFTGTQRLPDLSGNTADLPEYRQKAMAPAFVLFNAQVTKYFKNGFEIYLGAENLGNYTQKAPILGADNPFGRSLNSRPFDATAVYGPVMGGMAYIGLRYTFKPKSNENSPKKAHDHENGSEISIKTSAQCGMCKTLIEETLTKTVGVFHANLDLKTKKVNIHYNSEKTNPDALRKIISALGYHADSVKRNEEAHKKLPGCCQSND